MRSAVSGKTQEMLDDLPVCVVPRISCASDDGGGAVAEQCVGDRLLSIGRVLVVQAAEFDAAK